MKTQPHMRVSEFAARMDMQQRTVRARIQRGEIRAINVGSEAKPEYRISESELARWVAERTVTGGAAA